MKRPALIATVMLLLSGCMIPDVTPPPFIVHNFSGQSLIVGSRDPDPNLPRKQVAPGRGVAFYPGIDVCESVVYVATTTSGEVLAELKGGCQGYEWTIYGPNSSSYTKA